MKVDANVDHVFKVLVVGDANTGKTSLIGRYTKGVFNDKESSTIGTEFAVKVLTLRSKKIKLSIWDTAGQERFRSLTTNWYRQAHAVIIVYDITSRSSFDNISSWFDEVERNTTFKNAAKIIVGNKSDLDRQGGRVVAYEEGEALARERKTMFIECSAKEDVGVTQAFDELMEKVLDTPEFTGNSPSSAAQGVTLGKVGVDDQLPPACPC
jgi:Ras-related protein Rab-18